MIEAGHNNKKGILARRRLTETKGDVRDKLVVLLQQDAIGLKLLHHNLYEERIRTKP